MASLPLGMQCKVDHLAEIAALWVANQDEPASVMEWNALQERLREQITALICEAKA